MAETMPPRSPTASRVRIGPVDLVLERGDRVALIGPNGAGKSTVLRLLAGEQAPTAGRVRVKDGARVALMTQESLSLDLQRSPLDVVLDEHPMARDDAVRRICALGLDYDHCLAPLGRLSGGQRVRVHLLRVSLQRPDLLLLDEPTNYIDTHSAEVVQSELEAFTGCVVAATHDRYFLETFATRIVELTASAEGTRVDEREGLAAARHEHALEARYRARSLWLDGLAEPLAPRPALAGDRDCDVAIVGAGFTGPVGRLLPGLAAARPAHRRRRARDRGLRPVGSQRRLGLGRARGQRAPLRAPARRRRRASRRARHGRRGGRDRARDRGRGHRLRLAARRLAARRDERAPGRAPARGRRAPPRVRHRRGRSATAGAAEIYAARARTRRARRVVHAALRARRSGAARARTGAGLRAARRRRSTRGRRPRHRARAACAARAAPCAPAPCCARPRPTPCSSRAAPALHAALLADDRDRAAAARGLGGARLGRPRDDLRPAPPVLLRAAHPRRPHRDRRARRARTGSARRSTSPTSATTACAPDWSARSRSTSRRPPAPRSRITGAGRSACRATGAARCTTTTRPASAGRAATRATASSRATCSAARWPIWSCGATRELVSLPWVGHVSPRWEPEPLRFLASRAIVRTLGSADRVEDRRDRPAWRTRLVGPFMQVRS